MFGALDTATSADTQRTNLDVIAGNIAMKDVTRDENRPSDSIPTTRGVVCAGDPSRGADATGVHVAKIAEDPTPFGLRWDPGHVDAIKEGREKGYVRVSNVDYHTEMVNAMVAARAYEANVTVAEMAKRMAATTLALLA